MRVGLDGYPLATPRTGVGHYTFELARALATVAPSDEFEIIAPVPLHKSVLGDIARDRLQNLHVTDQKSISLRRRWWAFSLPIYLRRARLDLFHGTNYEVPLWNWNRTIITIHDLSILLHPDTHESWLVKRARIRLPLMARAATKIITVSEAVKREICEHLKVKAEKVYVTREAARPHFRRLPREQTDEARQRLQIEDEFILFVGTIEPRKNLPTLLRAFEEILVHTSLRPQLVIAGGEGWMLDEFTGLINRANIRDRIRLTGYINDDDLRALYSSCRAFVYPSLYEGFGLPPLEAMACGAPVVTSRIPSLIETVGSAASLISPEDVGGLSASLIELLTDSNKRESLSRAGLARAAEFSWEQTARETLKVYEEVINRKRG